MGGDVATYDRISILAIDKVRHANATAVVPVLFGMIVSIGWLASNAEVGLA